jgi:hypothetical protein
LCVQLQRFSDDGPAFIPPEKTKKINTKKKWGKYGTRRQIGICRVEEENRRNKLPFLTFSFTHTTIING